MDIEQLSPPPQRTMPSKMHGKYVISIATEYRKIESLSVKRSPSSNEEESSSEEDTNNDVKSLEKDDGQPPMNPHAPPTTGRRKYQLGFGFRVPIEEEPPSNP